MKNPYLRTKYTCYYTDLAMASAFSLPPLLFVTFREMYGISYTLLGTLVSVNFCTQLVIDLIFSFFGKHFPLKKTIRAMPLLTAAGLIVYAVVPLLFPQQAYAGLLIGTVIFSMAAGLCEVLLSPLVAAIPSDNPKRDMSTLHSLYAYGVVGVILISTLYFALFGRENWVWLTLFLAALPILSFLMLCLCPLPPMEIAPAERGKKRSGRGRTLSLFALCILLGGAAENTMTNWISSYIEGALGMPKMWGDIAGMALFAVLIGLGRTMYARYGSRIIRVLLFGMIGSAVCYLMIAAVSNVVISLLLCVTVGLTTSMLWPGTLILMEEKMPSPGVAAYALMAAGGDLGSSIAPQMVGAVVDLVSEAPFAAALGERLSMSPEQVGMKTGMLLAAVFPLAGVIVVAMLIRRFRGQKEAEM